MSNYLTTDELREIISLIDALDKVDSCAVSFAVKLYDSNGEEIGRIEQKEAGPVYYPDQTSDMRVP